MGIFSKEYLFRECVLHHHCILLRLNRRIVSFDGDKNEIYMKGFCLSEEQQRQMHLNIARNMETYGFVNIMAFMENESPFDAREIVISTDDIIEIELMS